MALGLQLYLIRREQGRFGELEVAVRALAERFPMITRWRTVLAYCLAELGRREEGTREFEAFAIHARRSPGCARRVDKDVMQAVKLLVVEKRDASDRLNQTD